MMNEELDHTIAKFLRSAIKQKTSVNQDSLHRQTVGLAERIRNSELADEIASIAKTAIELMRSRHERHSQTQAITLLKELNDRRWPFSAEVIYVASLPKLDEVEMLQLVSLAPTPRALTSLCKKLPAAKKAIDEIANRPPQEWLDTAVGDWLFQHAKIRRLESAFISALRVDKRSPGLKEPEELLQSAAQRDKKGLFLFAAINNVGDSASLARFASTILGKPKIAKTYLSVIRSPKGRKQMRDSLPKLLHALVSSSLADQRRSQLFRKTASLFMIGIISDIMLTHAADKPMPGSAMSIIKALDDLETAANSEEAKSNTWIVHTLEKPKTGSADSKIDLNAARILKIAFEETERGANALEVLEATAFNLGLRQIGEPNSIVAYDPHVHEDITGGLHPGDSVKVLRKGWSLDNAPIIRAKVMQQAS